MFSDFDETIVSDVTGEAYILTDLHSNGDELVSRHTLAAVFAAVVTGHVT